MKDQSTLQNILIDRFNKAKKNNPRYSIRAFAKKLEIHFAALSAIMKGNRKVSKKMAMWIADHLDLDPQERAELFTLFSESKPPVKKIKPEDHAPPHYAMMNDRQVLLAAEWEHFAVLSLLQCSEFKSSIPWIAERLNITETRARIVMECLMETNLISINSEGNYVRTPENYRTPDDVGNVILKKAHEQTFGLAQQSLYRDPIPLRDFSSVTFAVNPGKMALAKELIRKFQDDLCDQMEVGELSEVYRFSVQLFPLTKLAPEGQKT